MTIETAANLLDEYWEEPEFAQQVGAAVSTLRRWRAEKKGPPVTKIGRKIFYGKSSTRAWLKSREVAPA